MDASQFATGAVLSQKDKWGWLQPIGSISCSFSPAEWNYIIHDWELLAIIHGLWVWRHILLSTPYIITIYTNHKNLMFYRSTHRIAWRVAQYLGELADYHFTLVYKPGTLNHANVFSWQLNHDTEASDNEDVIVLGPELFTNAIELFNLKQDIFTAQEKYEDQIEKFWQNFSLDEVAGQWFYRRCPIVPEDEELLQKLLQWYHNHLLARHLGIMNTITTLARDFWWPT